VEPEASLRAPYEEAYGRWLEALEMMLEEE
jgi:hypothetical protein